MGLKRAQRHASRSARANSSEDRGALKVGVTAALCGILIGVGPASIRCTVSPFAISSATADTLTEGVPQTVDVNVVHADLSEVVHILEEQTGAEIVIKDGDQPFHKVNLSLRHATLGKALRNIAISAGAVVTKNSDGVYVIEPGLTSDTAVSDSVASPVTTQTESQLATQKAGYFWQKLVLKHAIPKDVLYLMHWDKDYREIAPLASLQMPSSPDNSTHNAPLYVYNPYGAGEAPSVPIGSGASGEGPANYAQDAANRAPDQLGTQQANQFPGGPGGFGGFRGAGGGGEGYGGGRFGGGPNQGVGVNQNNNGPNGNNQQGQLPDGVDRIYALQSDNSLLILATPEGFNAVKNIIKNIDVAPRQVEISVQFVEANVSDVEQYGINFSVIPVPGMTASSGLDLPGAPTFGLQYAAGNAAVTLSAELRKDHAKVVEAPMIATTNNTPASILVNQQVPYQTTSTVIPGGGGTAVTTTQQQFLNIPISLIVQPRINADDTVTLQLSPTITTRIGDATAGGPPPTLQQAISTLRTVHNGETMVLGGLIQQTETRGSTSVPFLSGLPIIGPLFKSKNVSIQDEELLIFVTPTIIQDDETPGQGSVTP